MYGRGSHARRRRVTRRRLGSASGRSTHVAIFPFRVQVRVRQHVREHIDVVHARVRICLNGEVV